MGQLTEFGKILIYLLSGSLLLAGAMGLVRLLSPKKPTALKLSSYECGEKPVGNSWTQFNTRFYVVALVFLLFDVEMVFIYPWATVFGQKDLLNASSNWGWLSVTEMFIFVGILLLGLVYVWKRKDLEWIKPEPAVPSVNTSVPSALYEQINNEEYKTRTSSGSLTAAPQTANVVSASRPVFKPTFRKSQK